MFEALLDAQVPQTAGIKLQHSRKP